MINSKSILLVEDDEDDQMFFTEALNEISNLKLYAIAKNGKEALELLEKNPTQPDIIFMDINMPLMNGIECLIEIRKREMIKNIPVIIISTDSIEVERLRQLGAKGCIKKPTDTVHLSQGIEEMIKISLPS